MIENGMPEIKNLQLAPASEFLDKAEMRQLTGRAQVNVQARWLEENNVPHRRDGPRLIVSRYHVREWLLGGTASPPVWEPDWGAIRGTPAARSESNQRPASQLALGPQRAALWAYSADLVDKIDSAKLACPEFHRIATEGRASMHFVKCDACQRMRAVYFPKV